MKKCKLCLKEKEIQESHIIPKFVYKWMKQTGTGRFRQGRSINKPLQDGIKEYLLCRDCEQKFGKREDWFKKNIFTNFINGDQTIFKPSEELEYFAVSLLWRVLVYFKDDGNSYKFKDKLDEAEQEWRKYLYENGELKKYKSIHLMCNPYEIEIPNAPKNIYSYLLRDADIEIGEGEGKCIIYAKFARFILIGIVEGFENASFVETDISQTMNTNFQRFNDSDIVGFIFDRAKNTKTFEDLSKEQKEKNTKYFSDRVGKIKGNDYWNQFLKDNK